MAEVESSKFVSDGQRETTEASNHTQSNIISLFAKYGKGKRCRRRCGRVGGEKGLNGFSVTVNVRNSTR